MENYSCELKGWAACKHILCLRADNMGDLLMSTPAIAAIKETLGCRITVLTSSKAAGMAKFIPEIDQLIKADLQWVRSGEDPGPEMLNELITFIRSQDFDGCVIFSVYSQNPLPSAMLAYISGIPLRLAYCRENPYHLLTDWVPDPEPYGYIAHQVERDLDLVRMIGMTTKNRSLRFREDPESLISMQNKLIKAGLDVKKKYIILHAGVSEDKRKYPEELWIRTGKLLIAQLGVRLLLTGSAEEHTMVSRIAAGIGPFAYAVAGLADLQEFAALIRHCLTLVSVNTGTIHLAAALQKPMVVLYAQTNPQHTPWMVRHKLLEYSVPEQSQNQVISYVNKLCYTSKIPFPDAAAVVEAVKDLLSESEK